MGRKRRGKDELLQTCNELRPSESEKKSKCLACQPRKSASEIFEL